MANTSNRDVKLSLSVDTVGAESVKDLQKAIQSLAAEGGQAAPEFQRLADEVGRLGEQGAALANFRQLAEATEDLRLKQEQAAGSNAELRARLDELTQSTEAARTTQARVGEAVLAAKQAVTDAATDIRLLRNEYDAAGRKTDEYRERMAELIRAQGEAKKNLDELKVTQSKVNDLVDASAAAQKQVETAYNKTATTLDRANKALADNVRESAAASAAAQSLGVATDNIAAAEASLVTALNQARTAAQARSASIEEMAEADRLLAIEEQGLADALAEGARELQAEQAALSDAADTIRDYINEQLEAASATLEAANAAQEAANAAAEMAEHNRLLGIQQQAANAAAREGADALEAEQAAIREAAQTANLLEAALREQSVQQQAAADAAMAAAQAINDAFGTVGVRGPQEIRNEIAAVEAAMNTLQAEAAASGDSLSGAFDAGRERIEELQAELREVNGEMTLGDQLAQVFSNSLGQITAGNLIADGVGYLVNKVKDLATAFVQTIAQTQQFRRALNAIYKDSSITAQQFAFLNKTALDAGVSVGSLQQSFVKFSAATKSANIPLEQTNALFAAVTNAAGTLGLNGEAVSGMLEALGQMASKGTVSLEELRQQLGDRLPGALSLVAQGFGISEAQLIKLVESGTLASRDLFPALTSALGNMQGEVSGLIPSFETLKNAFTTAAQEGGDAGWAQVLEGALKSLAYVLGGLVTIIHSFFEALFLAGKAIGAFFATLKGSKDAWKDFNQEVVAAGERVNRVGVAFGRAAGLVEKTNDSLAKNTVATQQSAAENAKLAAVAQTVASSVATTATALDVQAKIAANVAAANGNLGAVLQKNNIIINEKLGLTAAEIDAAEKNAKAIKTEGDATVELTALMGNQQETLAAKLKAEQDNLAAREEVARLQRTEVELLEVQMQMMMKKAAQDAASAESYKAVIEGIGKKLLLSQAEAEQADAAVVAARNQTEVIELQSKAYADNSANVEKYAEALGKQKEVVERLAELEAFGAVSKEDLGKAQAKLREITLLYNDSLADSSRLTTAQAGAEQARLNVQTAGLSVQQGAYERLAAAAKATGDLTTATYYEVEAKRVQIQITQLQASAKAKEAQAAMLAAEADLKLLEQTDKGNQVKRLEIQARLDNAKAKALEAGASADIVRALEAEINAIRNNVAARGSSVSATDSDTASRERNAQAIDKQTAALQRQQGKMTSDGFAANKDGSAAGTFNNALPVNTAWAIADKLHAGTITGADLEAAKEGLRQAQAAQAYLDQLSRSSAGIVSSEARTSTTGLVAAAMRAVEAAQQAKNREDRRASGQSSSGFSGGSTVGATSVVVNVAGRRLGNVNVSSPQDADALAGIIGKLETSAGTAA